MEMNGKIKEEEEADIDKTNVPQGKKKFALAVTCHSTTPIQLKNTSQ